MRSSISFVILSSLATTLLAAPAAQILPLDEVTRGMKGVGQTVFVGGRVEEFEVGDHTGHLVVVEDEEEGRSVSLHAAWMKVAARLMSRFVSAEPRFFESSAMADAEKWLGSGR